MSTATVTPAVKETPWQKVEHFFSEVDAVTENIELQAIKPSSPIEEWAPGVAKILTDLLTMQSNMRVALSGIPKGGSTAQTVGLTVSAIGAQVIADAALLGKNLSQDNITLMASLIAQAQAVVTNSPNITTAPTATQLAAAEASAGIPAVTNSNANLPLGTQETGAQIVTLGQSAG